MIATPSQPSSPAQTAAADRSPLSINYFAIALGGLLGLAALSFTFRWIEIGGVQALIKNFDETKWLALSIVLVLIAGLIAIKRIETAPLKITKIDIFLALLLVWMVVSLAWAPDPNHGAMIVLFGVFLFALYGTLRLLEARTINGLVHGLVLVGLVGSMVLPFISGGMETNRGFGNQNFHAEFKVVLLPLALAFWKVGPVWLRALTRVATLAGAVDLFVFASQLVVNLGSDLQFVGAVGVGLYLTYLFARKWQFWAATAIAVASVGAVIAYVLGRGVDQLTGVAPAVLARLQNWISSVGMALDHPLLGWGPGGYLHSFPNYREFYLNDFGILGAPFELGIFGLVNAHVHNDYLQIWVELGIVGVVLCIAIIVAVMRGMARLDRNDPVIWYGAGFAAMLAVALVGFPFQNPATAAVATVVLAAIVSQRAQLPALGAPISGQLRTGIAAAAILVAVGLGWRSTDNFRAEFELQQVIAYHRLGDYLGAVEGLKTALAISDTSPNIRALLFPEMMVAAEFNGLVLVRDTVEQAYLLGVSAVPHNHLILDFRIKFLLLAPDGEVRCGELQDLVTLYTRLFGRTMINPAIAEAAYALRVDNLEQAAAALARAKDLTNSPTSLIHDKPLNIQNNARNIQVLEVAMARRQRVQGPSGPICMTQE